MKTIVLEHNIEVYCIPASSFPDGIATAYERLHALFPPGPDSTYYGISFPDSTGAIQYKAAVHMKNGAEAAIAAGLLPFTIKKGSYLAQEICNFHSDKAAIGGICLPVKSSTNH